MKKTILFFLSFFLVFSAGWADDDLPPLPKGPLRLTSATPAMQDADYWIRRIPNAEKAIKTPEQVKRFNDEIRGMIGEVVDVFKLDKTRDGKQISDVLSQDFNTIRNRKLFDVNDKYVLKKFFDEKIKPLIQADEVPSKVKMRWGVAVRAASIRAIPTDVKMLEEKDDVEFDQLQFTQIKLWTPVGIFHESSDGKWFYVQAPYVRGWVKSKDVAVFESRDDVQKYLRPGRFLVVTGESCRIFRDSDLKEMIYRASMGTILPVVRSSEKTGKSEKDSAGEQKSGPYTVWMPFQKDDGRAGLMKAYVSRKSDVMKTFPTYSQANILRQAFKLLGARYGWGGMYNGRDCSGFVHDVFLSLGVDFPRDSKQQAMVGTQLGFFTPFQDDANKTAALKSARPGLTLIKMPHHQMMYLGTVNAQYYVIHSTWAERTGDDPQVDAKNRINQVVVSDLNLNGRSYIGSLFDRIVSINEVD